MNRLRWFLVALFLIGVLASLVQSEANRAISSVVSRGEDGWYGFRQALELRDISLEAARKPWTEIFDEDQIETGENAVLVVAFPWQKSLDREELQELSSFLRRGGTVWVAYSGSAGSVDEITVLESLGLGSLKRLRKPVPLSPAAWWRHRNERWELQPDLHGTGALRVEIPALEHVPTPPAKAEIYFSARAQADVANESSEANETGEESLVPLVFGYERFGGRVLAVPAALWSNAEILTAGNLAALYQLAEVHGTGTRWWVDEYHHGLLHPDLVQQTAANASWDTFFLHLVLIYCLGVWALARRFGPPWHERPARFGSTAEFLENLGGLHHRLGHHQAAARQMVARMADLYPQRETVGFGSELEAVGAAAEEVSDGPSLVRFSCQLGLREISAQKPNAHKSSAHKPSAHKPSAYKPGARESSQE